MIGRYLTFFIAIGAFVLTTSAGAGSSTNNDGGERNSPYSADFIFKIQSSDITYRTDGHMLVCVDKKQDKIQTCYTSTERLTLDEFWKWYFPDAPRTLRVVAMDYNTYRGIFIFWLKR